MTCTPNTVFDKVFLINLQRDRVKYQQSIDTLRRFNMEAERFDAVNGKECQNPSRCLTDPEYGLLLSVVKILERATCNNYRSILILEDDFIVHHDFQRMFASCHRRLSKNWKIWWLGASDWRPFKSDLYHPYTTTLGGFAVAVSRDAFEPIMSKALTLTRPIDWCYNCVGQTFRKDCFVSYPNLMIANTSQSSLRRAEGSPDVYYKTVMANDWKLEDYYISDQMRAYSDIDSFLNFTPTRWRAAVKRTRYRIVACGLCVLAWSPLVTLDPYLRMLHNSCSRRRNS